jgi:hypothetical protein
MARDEASFGQFLYASTIRKGFAQALFGVPLLKPHWGLKKGETFPTHCRLPAHPSLHGKACGNAATSQSAATGNGQRGCAPSERRLEL